MTQVSGGTTREFTARRVEAHGLGVHVTEWTGTGPTVVMLHAVGFTGRMFDPLARALRPEMRVLCPDIRGHGRTDHPPEGYQVPNLVRDLMGVVQMLRLKEIVLVGHTWGADVALSFAAQQPRRLLGLILIDGGYRHRQLMPGAEGPPRPESVRSADAYPSVEAAVVDTLNALGLERTPDLENAIVDSLEVRRDRSVAYRLNERTWGQIYKALWAYDPSPFLTGVQTPTLIVHPLGADPTSAQASVAAFQARAAQLLMHDAELLKVECRDNLSLLASEELALEARVFIRRCLKRAQSRPGR